ncbi:hypothetical protein [Qipengyuania sp. MTN3-11]|uniref:hypothetical protein n=1 Tax=Qipengyuania sp. MTN3-11 TaxID=3056557 RepID=UPI0036F3C8F0
MTAQEEREAVGAAYDAYREKRIADLDAAHGKGNWSVGLWLEYTPRPWAETSPADQDIIIASGRFHKDHPNGTD